MLDLTEKWGWCGAELRQAGDRPLVRRPILGDARDEVE
jgi:hypothetical protein